MSSERWPWGRAYSTHLYRLQARGLIPAAGPSVLGRWVRARAAHATHPLRLLTETFTLPDQLFNPRSGRVIAGTCWPEAMMFTTRFTNITPSQIRPKQSFLLRSNLRVAFFSLSKTRKSVDSEEEE